jgi:hypothetical protein
MANVPGLCTFNESEVMRQTARTHRLPYHIPSHTYVYVASSYYYTLRSAGAGGHGGGERLEGTAQPQGSVTPPPPPPPLPRLDRPESISAQR